MNKDSHFILFTTFILAINLISTVCYGAKLNPNVRYFGYDWLDGRDNISVQTAFKNLSSTGSNRTNLNVVHTIDNLNSTVCANKRCALNIGAGHFPSNTFLDICPSAKNDTECQSQGSWTNIWNIVAKIKTAKNQPTAIYFIDEPSFSLALRDSNGKYITWQYASYLCTLRKALSVSGLTTKIFTILGINELGLDNTPNNITNEIRHQMPSSGCSFPTKSTPDWIGIDNYEWKHVIGGQDDSPIIHSLYNQYFPIGSGMPKWVIVPPAASDIYTNNVFTDSDLHDRIQVYWDYLNGYPADPVITIMNFRFDPKVMTVPTGVEPNNSSDMNNLYWQSRNLLKFMGNKITP